MPELIRIAIVDDHQLVREGIAHVVTEAGGFDVVAHGASAADAIEIVQGGAVDILFLDLSIPGGGLSALEAIIATGQATKVIVLTISEDEEDVLRAFQLGANGYLLKGVSSSELIHALQTVNHKGAYVSPELGAKLLSGKRHADASQSEAPDALTQRELEIHDMVRRGLSNKEIGHRLDLSEKTIKHHMTRLFRKLNVRNRLTLAMLEHKTSDGPKQH